MKYIKSDLVLVDFAIVELQYKFKPLDKAIDLENLFNDYEIDIDFNAHKENEYCRVFVKLKINSGDNQKHGYVILMEGIGIFDISNIKKEDLRTGFIESSGLSVCVGFIRNYLAEYTSTFPYGRYMLPLVSLNEIIEQKAILQKGK